MIQGRLRLRAGDVAEAQRLLRRAVALSHVWGLASQIVLALTGLAEAELAAGDVGRARAAVAEARELVATEPIWRFAVRGLEEVEARVGRERCAPRDARRSSSRTSPTASCPSCGC